MGLKDERKIPWRWIMYERVVLLSTFITFIVLLFMLLYHKDMEDLRSQGSRLRLLLSFHPVLQKSFAFSMTIRHSHLNS